MGTKPARLRHLRDDIDSALDLILLLLEHGDLDQDEESELGNISNALTEVATRIDASELISRNAAIAALTNELGQSASDLNNIHQQAVDLKTTLDIAQKLLDGFGSIAKALTPTTVAAKPKSGKTT
jgi:hypothetical protein